MATLLSTDAIAEGLRALPGWRLVGATIEKEFTFAGFPEAVAFVSRLVAPAEEADHHPDLAIHYNRVVVTFSTHSAGGLTTLDLAGAAAVEALSK